MKTNIIVFVLLIVSSLSIVTSEQKYKYAYLELENLKKEKKLLNIEYSKLDLELSTLATEARIENIAIKKLNMKYPKAKDIKILYLKKERNE